MLSGLAFAASLRAQTKAPAPAPVSRSASAITVPAASAASASPTASASAPLASPGIELRTAPVLLAPPRGSAGRELPTIVRATTVEGRPDIDAVAEGDVELRRGGAVIRADRLTYDQQTDVAHATGHVQVARDGTVFTGPELQLQIDRFEGFFRSPTYRYDRTGAGGTASRINFVDAQRIVAVDATYSSCPADANNSPAWLLTTESLVLDTDANEGTARNAVLRFYGVPILAAPVLSFSLNDERKSGWLPPSFIIDSRSGVQFAIPYYWNIAPNRDATFTLAESSKRGPSLESEFRYLEPRYFGEVSYKAQPHDSLTNSSRYAFRLQHEANLPHETLLQLKLLRVSDDDYWKDFPRELRTSTPRLLGSSLDLSRPFGDWTAYARARRWQVLQTDDPTTRIDSPYERVPQVGARHVSSFNGGFNVGFEGEFNRFANPDDRYVPDRPTGLRVHALGNVSRPFESPGWTFTPKLSFNAASYSYDDALPDGRRRASRVIPTLSADSAWTFERDTHWFGRDVKQTLEPRLFYVRTPFRPQNDLPNFDASAKDFNFDSIFTENAFSGVDRVSDANELTAGVTSRIIDPASGAEALRVGVAQRYLFTDQRITPDGTPLTQRASNLLLFGTGQITKKVLIDSSVQYNPDSRRVERSLAGIRYSPEPFKTVALTYRSTRGQLEQIEVGWQWPVYGGPRATDSGGRSNSLGTCGGTLYSVGRVNYSSRDSRVVDSAFGLEYDAGCWIGRVVAERLSTGRSEATTRLLLQLELVGLSRLGSNPLRSLKDNIPGYQLLHEERSTPSAFKPYD